MLWSKFVSVVSWVNFVLDLSAIVLFFLKLTGASFSNTINLLIFSVLCYLILAIFYCFPISRKPISSGFWYIDYSVLLFGYTTKGAIFLILRPDFYNILRDYFIFFNADVKKSTFPVSGEIRLECRLNVLFYITLYIIIFILIRSITPFIQNTS